MTHLKKRVTFAGVDYILVPERLWEMGKDALRGFAIDGWEFAMDGLKEIREYEGTDEVEDSNV